MRISFKHRYVMFDIPKSASTSINFAIRTISECILDGHGGVKHTHVIDYERFIEPLLRLKCGPVVDAYERIAVVREPIDMLQSYFKYLRRPGVESPGHVDHARNTLGVEFADFLTEVCTANGNVFKVSRPSGFVMDAEGGIGIDALFSFARLNDLSTHLSARSGTEIDIPFKNISPESQLPDLDDAVIGLMRETFASDFALYDAIMRQPEGQPLRARHQPLAALLDM